MTTPKSPRAATVQDTSSTHLTGLLGLNSTSLQICSATRNLAMTSSLTLVQRLEPKRLEMASLRKVKLLLTKPNCKYFEQKPKMLLKEKYLKMG